MTSSKITQVVDAILPPLLDMLEMHTLARRPVTSDALRVCLTGALVVLEQNTKSEPVIAKGIKSEDVKPEPGDIVYFSDGGHIGYITRQDMEENPSPNPWGRLEKVNIVVNKPEDKSVVSQLRRDDAITRSFKRNLGYMLYDSLHQHGWVYNNRGPNEGTLNIEKIVEAICQHIMSFEPTMPQSARVTATEARELQNKYDQGAVRSMTHLLDTEGYSLKAKINQPATNRLHQPVKCTCCGNPISICRCVSR